LGDVAFDRVCPTDNALSCAEAFQFIAITSQSGLRSYEDGIIGMKHGETGANDPGLYVPQLKASEAIGETIFSFYMTNLSGQSYIDFGTPDESIIGDGSEIFWLDRD